MKKSIVMALLLVLAFGGAALAADVTISGEMKYGFEKVEGVDDAEWYKNPTFKLKFSNANFELRLVGQEYIDSAKLVPVDESGEPLEDGEELILVSSGSTGGAFWLGEGEHGVPHYHDYVNYYRHHNYLLETTTKYGVKVDRANVKLPVEGFGTFTAGRTYFGTSDWDHLGRLYDGLGWSGTFDKLAAKAMYSVGDSNTFGARLAYAFDLSDAAKLTVGGNLFQTEDEDEITYSGDARIDFGEAFDVYGEVGREWDKDLQDQKDSKYLCGEARLAGFTFAAGRDFEAEETEVYAEKTLNNVLFHLGYVAVDDEDGTLECYAKYTF